MFHPQDTLGPYTLIHQIGRGSFAEVWLAERRASLLTTQVALKLPFETEADRDLVEAEAQVWLQASGHPNVVPVLEAEVYKGQVVIVSEYVAGGSLMDWLAQNGGKSPSTEAAVAITRSILMGLDYLHRNSLIHRDLKPANILLQDGIPRLTDFGLTRILQSAPEAGDLAGTPAYMAPETFEGYYSPASDLWAVGVIFYRLLTGVLPFPQRKLPDLMPAIAHSEPFPLPEDIPEGLRLLVARSLAKSPAGRFTSASEMRLALETALTARFSTAASPLPLSGSLPTPPNNLPHQLTSFIGREKEIAEVKRLLASERLLTLTGSGGCGKTRLSLQAAQSVLADFPDGVWLVELAALSDPALVPQTIFSALGLKEETGSSLLQTLLTHLKSKNLLLILDNCEHLLDACAPLAESLLKNGLFLRILATSREPLRVVGEHPWRVPSLLAPEPERLSGEGDDLVFLLMEYDACRLFVERARVQRPAFALTQNDAVTVVRLCRQLDGIPLAIELAAARMRSLSAEDIYDRLDNRFRLLIGGSRTALPRQQTLKALIDWSYDLLKEQEKTLLDRLSVFAGGWTLEAAEKVCSGEGIEEWEVLDLLTSLVDKSLVVYEAAERQGRFHLLETMRQYAAERLADRGETKGAREQHQIYFLALAEEEEPKLAGVEETDCLRRLEAEHRNLRAALEHSLGEGDARNSLRLCGAISRFWWTRGYLAEGRAWCKRALGQAGAEERTQERAKTLSGAGTMAWMQGEFNSARACYEESLTIFREIEDQRGVASSLNNLGIVSVYQGDYTAARAFYEESLTLRRELGNKNGIAVSLNNLGNVAWAQGDYTAARAFYEESLSIRREIGDRSGVAISLNNLGSVAHKQNEQASARSYFEESLSIRREMGDQSGIAVSLLNLGSVAQDQHAYDLARTDYREGLSIFRDIGDRWGVAASLEVFAGLAMKEKRLARVATLWGAAEVLREEIGAPLSPNDQIEYDRNVTVTRKSLGEAAFAAAWEKGRAMTMKQAISLALEKSDNA